MLTSLDALIITFYAMSVITVLSIILLFVMKNPKMKKGIFYFLCVWGMIVAYCNVLSTPPSWLGEKVIALGWGSLSVAALLVNLCSKNEKKDSISRILVAASVIGGMIDCFLM